MASLLERRVYSNIKIQSALVLVIFYFDLPLFTQGECNTFFFEILNAPGNKQ